MPSEYDKLQNDFKIIEAEKLRQKRTAAYLHHKGVRCFYCESEDLEGGFVETNNGQASQVIKCLGCKKSWTDVYKLVDVADV